MNHNPAKVPLHQSGAVMDIADFTFYVIDQNLQRRNALARLLSKYARAVPLDNVSEVGSVSAGKPCFLVYDEERQLRACLCLLYTSDAADE